MLSHLGLAAAHQGMHGPHPIKGGHGHGHGHENKEWNDPLNAGDTANFAAGVLYALSGQYIDEQDYLQDCSVQSEKLDWYLQKSYNNYQRGWFRKANGFVEDSEDYWSDSMADCSRTNPYFSQISDHVHNFFETDGWEETSRTNYEAQ